MKTIRTYYRVDRREIAFIKFIIEAYEGIAVVRTIDAKKGLIGLHTPPGCLMDVEMLIHDLSQDITMKPIDFIEGEDVF